MSVACELISTGNELLNGRSINSHARTLAQLLAPRGVYIQRDVTIPDQMNAIAVELQEALAKVDLVFVSGGLGPTVDDITRDAVAQCLGRSIILHKPTLERIHAYCRKRGIAITDLRDRQALIVEGAEVLDNPAGIAPGECIRLGEKTVFMLPGPPREVRAIMHEHVLPRIRTMYPDEVPYLEKIFMVCGSAEADIAECFRKASFPPEGIAIGYCASPGRIEVRLVPESLDAELESAAEQVRFLLGDLIYAEERIDLEEAIVHMLEATQQTVAVAESCTGGLVGYKITSVSGSSSVFKGGIIAYDNGVKEKELGVDGSVLENEGAVSDAVARMMAEGVRRRFNTDYGVSITGVAGPTGGTEEKPVGLVYMAVADSANTVLESHRFRAGREGVRMLSAQYALNLLRHRMVQRGPV